MRVRENERVSRLKITELTLKLQYTLRDFLSENDMSYHEVQAALIHLMNSNNEYAIRQELGISDGQ